MKNSSDYQVSFVGIVGKNNESLNLLANLYHEPFDPESVLSAIVTLTHKPIVKWKITHTVNSWFTSIDESQAGIIFAVNMDGELYIFNRLTSNKLDLNCPDGLNSVWALSDIEAYSAGFKGKIVHIKGSQIDSFQDPLKRRFNYIHGSSSTNIYVSGDSGTVYYFNGETWVEIKTPTNVNLLSVYCVSEKEVYFGGTHGVLLKWDGKKWEGLKNAELSITITGLAFYEGKLYISTGKDGVYMLNKNKIELVKKISIYRLEKVDNLLFGIANRLVVQYDGHNWWGGDLDI